MHYSGEGNSNIGSTGEQSGAGSAEPDSVGSGGIIGSRGPFRSPLFRGTPRASAFSGGVEQVSGQSGSSPAGAVGNGFNKLPLTVTVNSYVTLTDLALHTAPVTLTQLVVRTTTRRIEQVR